MVTALQRPAIFRQEQPEAEQEGQVACEGRAAVAIRSRYRRSVQQFESTRQAVEYSLPRKPLASLNVTMERSFPARSEAFERPFGAGQRGCMSGDDEEQMHRKHPRATERDFVSACVAVKAWC